MSTATALLGSRRPAGLLLDLDAPGEGRRQLAQVSSALSLGIKPGVVAGAIRETLVDSEMPADPCSACVGVGLDTESDSACPGCSGYGSTVTGRKPGGYIVHIDIDEDGGVAATGTPGDLGRWLLSTSVLAGDGESITICFERPS